MENPNLWCAAYNGKIEDVRKYLALGADVNKKDAVRPCCTDIPTSYHRKQGVLCVAASAGFLEVVKELIQCGADNGYSPLYAATLTGHLHVVQELVDNGANIDAPSTQVRCTPLHQAVEKNHLDIIQALIDNGADVNAKDAGNRTARSIAVDKKHGDVVKALDESAKNPHIQLKPVTDDVKLERAAAKLRAAEVYAASKTATVPLTTFYEDIAANASGEAKRKPKQSEVKAVHANAQTEVASLPLHPPVTPVLPPSPPPATSSSPFGADMFLKLAAHPSTAHLVTLPDLVLVLLDLQRNPSQLFMHVGDIRVTQALQVLGTPLPEETVSNAFGTTMIQTLATNAATCGLVCDAKGLQNLIAIQQDPLTVNQYMTDPRIAQALTVLFQTSSTPLQNSSSPTEPAVASSNVVVEPSNDNLPAITTLSQLTAQLRSDPLKQWPLTGKYLVCGQVLGESNHCVFKAINQKRPSDDLVVKLTQQVNEVEFFNWLNRQDKKDVVKLSQRVVVCEEWGAVDVLGFQCQALIMEKGQYSVGDQLRHLQGHQYPRYRCLEDILDAVVTLHQLQYVHCDLKPENVVFFGDSDGYKLVDFDNARPVRTPLTKNCTEQYCPPEMAHFMLGHTTDPPVATTKYDVWCTAVLVLKLFSKPGTSLIEFDDGVPLLDTIASPMFSFAESVSLTQLSSDRQKSLLKCLHIDPKQRGSLQDLVDLLPDTSTKKGGMTRMCNKLEELTVKVENNLSISTETLHVSKATYAKVVDMKRDLMKGMFEATEVTVPTSFIILPFNIQTQRKQLASQPKDLVEQATGFFHRLQTVGSTILKAIQDNNPLSATKAALDAFSKGQPMYFYLLDDVTGLPVEDETGVYPIQITTTTDQYTKFMATNMPLFQRGLKLLQMANSAAGFFKALGIPSLGEATMAKIEGLLEVPGSSVSDFNVVQRALDDKTEVKAARGPALRELERFYHDKDEAKSFAGLSRVPTDSGLATWTRL
ncbi:hypothetical protein DYB34_007581 [Aphanomyces astaci]|uniref:Protein kinase domain-containing protein n=1 Tax=Aphanomyces astaci TaxID=112090 RepID=A0A418C5M1_APHAT|nr:hypothetical protein DYB34_007581 [Aphanomyces astaci]